MVSRINRCLVIGLDGATWNILKPLMKDGELPTITNLVKGGCSAKLVSSIPPVTLPAWKCYSTGKNPGRIGVYWFINVDTECRRIVINNSTSIKSREIWDYLNQQGIVCGIVGMPGMYPPKKIKGFIVCEDAPSLSNFTYPKELGGFLKRKVRFKLGSEFAPKVDTDKYIEQVKELIKQRFETAALLHRRFGSSFMHLTIYHIDTIQHFFWKEMEEADSDYEDVIKEIWILVDREIGKLLDAITNEETYVIIMSDHGFTAAKSTFQLAKWFMDEEYLVLKGKGLRGFSSKLPVNGDIVLAVVQKSKLSALLRRFIHRDLRSKIFARLFPSGEDMVEKNPLEGLIDWEKSKAIPVPQGLIYINKSVFSSKERARRFRDKLIAEIRRIRNPKNSERLAKKVYCARELYSGENFEKAPDIIVMPNEGYEIACSAIAKKLWNEPKKWTGVHKREGILIVKGPGIHKGAEMENVSILDLAPTILHMFNMPIPKDMDGRLLMEIFQNHATIATQTMIYEEIHERERIKRKIQELKRWGKI